MNPTCVLCDAAVTLPENPISGEIIPCADCGGELEILSLTPLKLGEAPAIEEDWGE